MDDVLQRVHKYILRKPPLFDVPVAVKSGDGVASRDLKWLDGHFGRPILHYLPNPSVKADGVSYKQRRFAPQRRPSFSFFH